MKIDLKAKLIVSLIHLGYLDCFDVCLLSLLFRVQFIVKSQHPNVRSLYKSSDDSLLIIIIIIKNVKIIVT